MRRLPGLRLMYLSLKFVRGYHCPNEAIGKLVKLLHVTFLNRFNFLQLLKIILESSSFTSKPLRVFLSLCMLHLKISALRWILLLSHEGWILIISSGTLQVRLNRPRCFQRWSESIQTLSCYH